MDGPLVSSLPIHQDGSCNGLQHYASLGRDKLGATYVNVVPGSAPQDIYGECVNRENLIYPGFFSKSVKSEIWKNPSFIKKKPDIIDKDTLVTFLV